MINESLAWKSVQGFEDVEPVVSRTVYNQSLKRTKSATVPAIMGVVSTCHVIALLGLFAA